jgi:predicted PurR-regulated permease PerM
MWDRANLRERTARALTDERWVRWRTIAFTLVCWLVLAAAGLWVAAHIIHALLILLVSCLIAYALYPLVEHLRRFMPRALALLVVYVLLLAIIGGFGYMVVSTAVTQFVALVDRMRTLLMPGPDGAPGILVRQLEAWGVSPAQIAAAQQDLLGALQAWTGQIVPVLTSLVNAVLDTVLVVVLSVYLLLDGAGVATWANTRTPLIVRPRVTSFLETLQRVVGGYIRGQLALCALIGVLVGVGMAAFQVPYAVLLGVMAFVLEFIPIIGVMISGTICVLLALTHGWPVALGVLLYFIVIHVIEGDVIGPKIVGRAVGLHPVVSIFALIAGAELFGIWGALLAAPIVGLAQAILVDAWAEWRKQNPDQFTAPDNAENPASAIAGAAAGSAARAALNPGEADGTTADDDAVDVGTPHDE